MRGGGRRAAVALAVVAGAGAAGCAGAQRARAGGGEEAATAGDAREEPVALTLEGWSVSTPQSGEHLHASFAPPEGTCRVVLDRWWGRAPEPAGETVLASRRAVTVGGRASELVTASSFEGTRAQVAFVTIEGSGYVARVAFRDCDDAEIDRVLRGVMVRRR